MVWSSLIGAGATLGAGLLSKSAQDKATSAVLENSAQDRALQMQFAQQGIRWRVDDAKAAGIHPLYAMGASIPAYNPSPISINASDGFASSLASAGQNISRAVQAKTTQQERQELAEAQKGLLTAQTNYYNSMAAKNAQQTPPPLPVGSRNDAVFGSPDIPGADPNSNVNIRPSEPIAGNPNMPGVTAGGHAGGNLIRIGKERYLVNPNQDVIGEELTSPGVAGFLIDQQKRPKPPPFDLLRKNHPWATGWKFNRVTRHWIPSNGEDLNVAEKYFPMSGIPRSKPRIPHRGGRRNIHGSNRWGGIER